MTNLAICPKLRKKTKAGICSSSPCPVTKSLKKKMMKVAIVMLDLQGGRNRHLLRWTASFWRMRQIRLTMPCLKSLTLTLLYNLSLASACSAQRHLATFD